ncbi:MAG: rod shape-determining protein RodA [Bacteroidetes bacterium]|nr:rod shape-determining protein RodA [Bacteroidota bacterium]
MIVNKKISLYSKVSKYIDVKTLIITLLLVLIGLICLYSAVINNSPDKFNMQVIWAVVGFFAMLIISRMPLNFIKSATYIFFAIIAILLAGLFIFGTEMYGTIGWYTFGSFSFQPAEFSKIALIIVVARFFSTKGNSVANIIDVGKIVFIAGIPFMLIFLQPDVGTALTLFILLLAMLFWAGADPYYGVLMAAILIMFIASLMSLESVLIIGSIIAVGMLFFKKKIHIYVISMLIVIAIPLLKDTIYNNLPEHQQQRISVFIEPKKDVQNIGYNLNQSKLAVGSGGITGKGYMQGNLNQFRYIPKHYNDFIYSVPAEEFGFIGSILILFLLVGLSYRGINVAFQSKDIFASLIAFGSAIIMLFHTFYNVGMVIGVLPVMGIPLPFFSQGGTFLLSNFIYVGLIMNVNRNNNL